MRGGDNDGGDNVVKGGGFDGEDVDDTLPSGVGASVSTESSSSHIDYILTIFWLHSS